MLLNLFILTLKAMNKTTSKSTENEEVEGDKKDAESNERNDFEINENTMTSKAMIKMTTSKAKEVVFLSLS